MYSDTIKENIGDDLPNAVATSLDSVSNTLGEAGGEGGSYLVNGPLRFVSQLPAARPALCSLLVLCNYLDDWTAHQGQPIST